MLLHTLKVDNDYDLMISVGVAIYLEYPNDLLKQGWRVESRDKHQEEVSLEPRNCLWSCSLAH